MIRVMNDRIAVVKLEAQTRTSSGIIIPDTVNMGNNIKGIVVAIGSGKLTDSGVRIPVDIKVGDIILFNKGHGVPIKVEDKEYLVLREQDILAVLDEVVHEIEDTEDEANDNV